MPLFDEYSNVQSPLKRAEHHVGEVIDGLGELEVAERHNLSGTSWQQEISAFSERSDSLEALLAQRHALERKNLQVW